MTAEVMETDRNTRRIRDWASEASGSGLHRLNQITAALIIGLLAATPIPLGSNRPVFWMIWSVLVGLLAFGYAASLLCMGVRLSLTRLWPEALALMLLCLFIGIQILPIGPWLPDSIVLIDQLALRLSTISYDPGSTRLVLIQFFTFGLLFLLVDQVALDPRRARRMLFAIMIVIALFAGYGLASLSLPGDTILGFDKQVYEGYATGPFINRNSFATYLAVGLVVCASLLFRALGDPELLAAHRLAEIATIMLCFLVVGAGLVATGSRMGTAAAGGGVLITTVLGLFVSRGSAISAVSLITAAAVLAGIMFGTPLIERLLLLPGVDETRVHLHQQVWQAILQHPWLGYGAGSFGTVFPLFQRPPISTELVWENAHSTYLALWFELGLIAGSIPLMIVAFLTLRALRTLRDRSSPVAALAAIGTVTVFAIHSSMDFSAEIEANAFLFTVILALGTASARRSFPSGGPGHGR